MPMPAALTTPFVRPAPAGSRRGCRSSSAALAAPRARPVATPWMPRATKSQATEPALMKITVVPMSTARETSRTGRRPTRSDTLPASSSATRTPNAYVA